MIIYLVCFFISVIFIYLSERVYKKSRILSFIFIIFGITIPTLLGAFRNPGVGTDTRRLYYV